MQIKRLFATTSFRLASLYAGLMIGAFVLAAVAVWFATLDAGRRELERRVDAEIGALQLEFSDEGFEPVALAIQARRERPGALEYRLVDAAGRLRIGDLPASVKTGWTTISDEFAGEARGDRERLLIFTTRLPDGSMLSVGDDLDHADRMRTVLLTVFGWTGLLALLIGLTLSVVLTRRSLRRIDLLIGVAREVTAGTLDARALSRATTAPDDLDELGGALNLMLDRIETLVASVRQVSVGVAHDLRTPLSHVRQRLEMLKAGDISDGDRAEIVDSIDAKIGEILRTFDAMLRLAQLESTQTLARAIETDLGEVAERLADAFRPDIEGSGRHLIVDIQPVKTHADPDLIAQLLANLIENALRHTPVGASISVSAGSDGAHAFVAVSDTGAGIPEAEREDVTKRFYRLERSRTTPGSGLGLSIVAAIARMHNASLHLEDNHPGLKVRVVFSTAF